MERKTPSIVDLDGEFAKFTVFRGRTPQSPTADREGSAARLAPYREGALLAGKSHRETPPDVDDPRQVERTGP